MIKSFSLLILLNILSNCTSNVIQNKPQEIVKAPKLPHGTMMCITLYLPVCGKDGKTYSNACNANNAGVEFTQGECQPTK
jgi:hypothetical protein